ncbi:hypothetical protein HHK36_017302 [Tetracentron sinense]|uniref:Uncharacterized protein n=1 Tax=Tetracentron sinense TaxID=13715 RepID=A0A834Z149_TETSI|nr:hypothetical protein HHK36_017302 [Tetracentron sinense]
MVPSSSSRRRKRRGRRTQYKRRILRSKNQEKSMELPFNSTTTSSEKITKINEEDENGHVDISTSGFSTPKAKKFRIPEIRSCPPAPKKQRVTTSNCSSQRSPIAFFAHPDLELFFFNALRDIPV